MHRLIVTYPVPANADSFLTYYTQKHVPLARTLPGVLDCRFVQPKALGPGAASIFLLFEADFATEAAMFAALGSPQGAQVAADVPNYSPGGATLLHYEVQGA